MSSRLRIEGATDRRNDGGRRTKALESRCQREALAGREPSSGFLRQSQERPKVGRRGRGAPLALWWGLAPERRPAPAALPARRGQTPSAPTAGEPDPAGWSIT